MKLAGRVAAILTLAAVFVGLTAMYVELFPPWRHRVDSRMRERRAAQPDARDLPGFAGQFVLIGGIALVGRKVLGVRLSGRR